MEATTIQNFAAGLVNDMRATSPEVWEQVRNEILTTLVVEAAAKKIAEGLTLDAAISAAISELVEGEQS
jgi:hypothetical protein